MSQKNYIYEIIDNLLRKENHIRGLAKVLNSNQTTIARKMKELEEHNVVDYREEGKNKVYFLKNTLEAQAYVFMTEHYKFIQLLERYPFLKPIMKAIKQNKKIKLAMLFGSYVKGLAHADSDIDIYVETTDHALKKEIEQINTKLSVKIGTYHPKSFLIKEIEKHHVIIKGVERYYEKSQFFDSIS